MEALFGLINGCFGLTDQILDGKKITPSLWGKPEVNHDFVQGTMVKRSKAMLKI